MNWIEAAAKMSRQNIGWVLVTVIAAKGSSPREVNAKMVVTAEQTHDSIGGGNLEFEAQQTARELLASGEAACLRREFLLGADLSQCCGGAVELLFECFPACRFNIALFGAGHVGKAVAAVLAELPCRVRWVDSRADVFPSAIASNIDAVNIDNPAAAVESCPPDGYYLIMTHSHDLDFEICEAVLRRNDSRYCGLIGSKSKGARFRSRLKKCGIDARNIASLTCPIGLENVGGKTPMEVAVSVAAQLLALRDNQ